MTFNAYPTFRHDIVMKRLGETEAAAILRTSLAEPEFLHTITEDEAPFIVSLLEDHRIVGRVLGAISDVDSPVRSRLERLYNSYLGEIERRRDVLSEFFDKFCKGMEVIILKTYYSHLILEDPWSAEPNSDIDFMVSEPNTLAARLRTSGLSKKSANWPDPCHEMEVVDFREVRMELHRYIPLWSALRSHGPCVDLARRRADAKTRPNGFGFDDLKGDAVNVQLLHARQVMFSDAAKHILIIMSSRYRDTCLYPHARLYKAAIRLSEMIEVKSVLDRVSGAADALRQLIQEHHIEDMARWFGSTMSYWIGDDRILQLVGGPSEGTVPKLLAGQAWIDLPTDPAKEPISHPTTSSVLDVLQVGKERELLKAGEDYRFLISAHGVALSVGFTGINDLSVGLMQQNGRLKLSLPIAGDISVHQEFRAYVEINSTFIELFGVRSFNDLKLRKWYYTWDKGENNTYSMDDSSVLIDLDLRPFLEEGSTELDFVLAVGVPQYPRDTDRGWIWGVRCALDA
ncbi:hypothetical protein [Rhizobium leguminosarum]|uniref:hypothetical protein n=1 Tax=Rhizobium leguminosarum TaxID=384 RepID=UPI001C979D00|nr:hypothetical protein [Rhizobium leguminosarum]MBY5370564.1 hypothetical protein [Rhizobium leguminosarum]